MLILIGGTPTGTLKHISGDTYRRQCGMLTSWRDGAKPHWALKLGAAWAMDNFAFTNFDPIKFYRFLGICEGVPGCLFCVSPDRPRDAVTTALLFDQWHDIIKQHGYPIALAAQNGLENMSIEWRSFDALFIGGDDSFKFSEFTEALILEAKAKGKWTHNGRINSWRRWNIAQLSQVDSVDGSGLAIERRRVLQALAVVDNPTQQSFVFGLQGG